ncbi:hypothetical protein MXD62_33590 [Frankia sp. Mgl5]|uniref:hypothetical protein n=1 Tax=Frankiaceae TaxID=74712 RepID=UPI0000540FBF|nr:MULTISPECIES: hypothetical protein [Frankiaceae]ABW15139.1 conserved hypothetical protein [Frankia sp. EAN1pec]CAI7976025.1 conserved hypothetical protein [Frankia sp. Hr75.2]MCK9932014.1 hypothetical protein [Frankia sp. Mgl5]TCJ34197.1 hypothetical protein E0504_33565 [Parafrankia sp. BMG5.11]SQD93691.1 conserved hypothetical protein [Parafrankia sp. Ea1.12]
MCCDDLVCARCAAPVAEGRCPACRAARESLHHSSFTVSPQLLIALLTVLLALMLLAGYRV